MIKKSILQVGYIFTAIKNEMNCRTTGSDFNIIEQFQYDDMNRLYIWTDPVSEFSRRTKNAMFANKGRITQNDQVGTIRFNNVAKKYQATGRVLNAEGTRGTTPTILFRRSTIMKTMTR